ncbi:MAG: hypothetical protein BWX80_00718 [Candidatus Hydrogenedentes bacterium ADurb.Bin101]|nr:MAG: hypothetical protein BWX80_00718 [Candidatus Hydrogenedentes bacterium ADurb.Bin101]
MNHRHAQGVVFLYFIFIQVSFRLAVGRGGRMTVYSYFRIGLKRFRYGKGNRNFLAQPRLGRHHHQVAEYRRRAPARTGRIIRCGVNRIAHGVLHARYREREGNAITHLTGGPIERENRRAA